MHNTNSGIQSGKTCSLGGDDAGTASSEGIEFISYKCMTYSYLYVVFISYKFIIN